MGFGFVGFDDEREFMSKADVAHRAFMAAIADLVAVDVERIQWERGTRRLVSFGGVDMDRLTVKQLARHVGVKAPAWNDRILVEGIA